MLNIIFSYTLFISIIALKSFYLNILIKIKEAVPPIVKTAAKIFETPIKSSKKWYIMCKIKSFTFIYKLKNN